MTKKKLNLNLLTHFSELAGTICFKFGMYICLLGPLLQAILSSMFPGMFSGGKLNNFHSNSIKYSTRPNCTYSDTTIS